MAIALTIALPGPWPGAPEKQKKKQLFRERLTQKVHATVPKGIVGGFEFAFLQRKLKELHERPWTYVCAC